MPQAGFETTIPASERSKPHALDRGATQEKICDPYIRDLYRSPAITGEVKWRKSTVCLTCGSDGERRNGNDWGCKISYKSTNFNLCQNTGINMWDIIVVKDVFIFRATTPAFRGEGEGEGHNSPNQHPEEAESRFLRKAGTQCKNTIDTFSWKSKTSNR